ncbi:MAG: GAF domain-containing protein [Candidatus Zixiibacteriota bacterium]|nr:MAG: GAF domain-containing protein [candidate division Zixibacteria bacterium]
MKRRGRNTNRKAAKSAGRVKSRKLSYPSQEVDALKANLDVATGICRMIGRSGGGRGEFEEMLNLIGKSVEFSHASLFLLDRKSNQMTEVASVGKKVDLIDFVRFEGGVGLSSWVAKEKRPIVLSNLHRKRGGEKIKSFLAMPLILDQEVFGVMNLCHVVAHAFEPGDVRFLTLISMPMALCLERMFYHSEVERLESELEQTRECSAKLQEEIARVEGTIPTSELLENLKEKVTAPLGSVAENARFLLESFSTRQDQKSLKSGKSRDLKFKRGLREIKNEVNQITRATEKLLRKNLIR